MFKSAPTAVNKPRYRWPLHLLLFVATLATTTTFGCALARAFYNNQALETSFVLDAYTYLIHGDSRILTGLQFSVPLLLILLVHEFGHYLACQSWHVRASLPYFMPAPTLLGTLGAFIRIQSPIYTRDSLFDIGISGPLAGFCMLLPFLATGIVLSRISPGIANAGDIIFGTPLLIRFAEWMRFGRTPIHDIALHPMARAAWAGLLATAINLLPVGQLDGGHILYSLTGDLHRPLSRLFLVILLPLGFFFYWGWIVWAVLLFFIGLRPPFMYDQTPLGQSRVRLAYVALAVFVLSFSIEPVGSR